MIFLHSKAVFAEERVQNLKFCAAIKEFGTLRHKLQIKKSAHQCDFSILNHREEHTDRK